MSSEDIVSPRMDEVGSCGGPTFASEAKALEDTVPSSGLLEMRQQTSTGCRVYGSTGIRVGVVKTTTPRGDVRDTQPNGCTSRSRSIGSGLSPAGPPIGPSLCPGSPL